MKYTKDENIRYDENTGRQVLSFKEIEIKQNEIKLPWKDEGVYLITGGNEGLGLIFSKEIGDKVRGAKLI